MLSAWCHAVVVGAITWCCCHQWHCCLVLLFMMPFTAPVTFPLPSAFWCWLSLLTVCHQQLLLSTITINHCCWPLPLIIAVDHCCWPLLSPTPLPFIVAWLLLSLLSISVIVNRYPHHCHHCCCYCHCYCHHHHCHCDASAVLHGTGCSSSPTCVFFFFCMSTRVPSTVQWQTGFLFHFMCTCTTIVQVGYCILQKCIWFPSALFSY